MIDLQNCIPDPTVKLSVEKLGSLNVKALSVEQLQRMADYAIRHSARRALSRASAELQRRAKAKGANQ